jgi:transcription-repair coupling factor (superfamily II helicase)
LFCSNEAQAKRFHDIFESLDETNAENKQYNTIVLPLYQGFIDEETKLPATDHQILNAIINSILKQLFEKQNITLKLTTLSVEIM